MPGKNEHSKSGKIIIINHIGITILIIIHLCSITLNTTDAAKAKDRVLHFPTDQSVGTVSVQDENLKREIKTFFYWVDGVNQKWESLADARGEVTIPVGKRVLLTVYPRAPQDLSWISNLKANEIYKLSIYGDYQGGPKPDDRCMAHIAGLTGLKVLLLVNTNISDNGMKHVPSLQSLQRLTIGGKMSDKTMNYISQLESLKGIYLKGTNITNAGLRHLAKAVSLEELVLQNNKYVGDRGLVHLSELPNLRYLLLQGENFSDKGMRYLRDIRSLRILHLGYLTQLTDAALVDLSHISGLQNLCLYWNKNISDEGISHLCRLPSLKKLDIGHSQATDRGLARLAEVKTLEYLKLPGGVIHRRSDTIYTITDEGLAHLSKLENLRHLSLSCSSKGVAFTDAGLKKLKELKSLEVLLVGGKEITASGVEYIASLPNLRELSLFGCPRLGNDGLAVIGRMESLKELWLGYTDMTASELRQLNSLNGLTNLKVSQIDKGYAPMDISGLRSLEQLSIDLKDEEFFDDKDLECLSKLKGLKWLQIGPRQYTDSGVAKLAGLSNMERLAIGGPDMTDKALSYLSNMKKLKHLTISDGDITDKGISYLEDHKAMGYLNITSSCDISPGALEGLREKIPNLNTLRVNENWKVQQTPRAGQKAPDFKFTTMNGKTIELTDFKDKVVLLYFWAMWCRPCIASMPSLKRFYEDMSQYKDFEMINISQDNAEHLARNYIQENNLSWPQVCVGLNSKVGAEYGVSNRAPFYFLVGPDGKIVSTSRNLNMLAAKIDKILGPRGTNTRNSRPHHRRNIQDRQRPRYTGRR